MICTVKIWRSTHTTSEAVDEISLQPEFKFTAVALAKVELGMPDDFTPEQK